MNHKFLSIIAALCLTLGSASHASPAALFAALGALSGIIQYRGPQIKKQQEQNQALKKAIAESGEITKDIKVPGISAIQFPVPGRAEFPLPGGENVRVSVRPGQLAEFYAHGKAPESALGFIETTKINNPILLESYTESYFAYLIPQKEDEDQATYLTRLQTQKQALLNKKVNEILQQFN